MKPEFLKAVHDAIGNVEHIHIEESGDSSLIHHDDAQQLQQAAKTSEKQQFPSAFTNNWRCSHIEVLNR